MRHHVILFACTAHLSRAIQETLPASGPFAGNSGTHAEVARNHGEEDCYYCGEKARGNWLITRDPEPPPSKARPEGAAITAAPKGDRKGG